MIMEALVASEPAPVMSFHRREPEPTPSGAAVAETNWKQPALNVSSSGNVGTAVSPLFKTTMRNVTLLLMFTEPFVGLNNDLVIVIDACVIVIATEPVLVAVPPFAVAKLVVV